VQDDLLDTGQMLNAMLSTALVGLCLVIAPTLVAVPVLVVLAFACGRLGGRAAGFGSVAAGTLMFGYAITEPHFVWEIENNRDVVLLIVLFVASLAASELGTRLRLRTKARQQPAGDRPPTNG
jgi:K+-sensing histidine kinase KdpD